MILPNHPTLSALLEEISFDSGMSLLDTATQLPPNLDHLEKLANRLNLTGVDSPELYCPIYEYTSELSLMATGEEMDMKILTETKGLQELFKFLNEAFDGEYSNYFFLE